MADKKKKSVVVKSRTVPTLLMLITLFLIPVMLTAPPVNAVSDIKVFIDGGELAIDDVAPVIINDRIMVPLRAISEGLGMKVEWVPELRLVKISNAQCNSGEPNLPGRDELGSDVTPLIFINNVQLISDTDPIIVNSRTMVPLRAVSEGLGMKVDWDEVNRFVLITRPEPAVEPGEMPVPDETAKVGYLGIGIIGTSQADAGEMCRAALIEAARLTNMELSTQEAASYAEKAVRNPANGAELTAAEVECLSRDLQGGEAQIGYSAAEKSQILTRMADTYYKLARTYLYKGMEYGLRGDIAFFQAAHETGWWKFGGLVKPDQNNYCGLSATGRAATANEDLRGANPNRVWFVEGRHGAFFDTPVTGIEAHLQHLYAYSCKNDLPAGKDLLSPRFNLVCRGIAPNWEDLGGKWAVPGYPRGEPYNYQSFDEAFAHGHTYGQKILQFYFLTGANN